MMILLKSKTQDSFPDSSALTKRQSGEFAHRSEEPGLDTRGTRADKNSAGPKSVGHTKHGSVRAASDCLMPDYSRCSARLTHLLVCSADRQAPSSPGPLLQNGSLNLHIGIVDSGAYLWYIRDTGAR